MVQKGVRYNSIRNYESAVREAASIPKGGLQGQAAEFPGPKKGSRQNYSGALSAPRKCCISLPHNSKADERYLKYQVFNLRKPIQNLWISFLCVYASKRKQQEEEWKTSLTLSPQWPSVVRLRWPDIDLTKAYL